MKQQLTLQIHRNKSESPATAADSQTLSQSPKKCPSPLKKIQFDLIPIAIALQEIPDTMDKKSIDQENELQQTTQQTEQRKKSKKDMSFYQYIVYHLNSIKYLCVLFYILSLAPLIGNLVTGSRFYLSWKNYFNEMGNDLFNQELAFFGSFSLALVISYFLLLTIMINFILSYKNQRKLFLIILVINLIVIVSLVAFTLIFLIFSDYNETIKEIDKDCGKNNFKNISYYSQGNQNRHQDDSVSQQSNEDNVQNTVNNAYQHKQKCPQNILKFVDLYSKTITSNIINLVFFPMLAIQTLYIGNKIQKNAIQMNKDRNQIINNGVNNSFRAY